MITLDQLQGHWIRDWIKAPEFEDHTTRVHWMQCGAVYADVRIPAERPDTRGVFCLAELPPAALAQLAKAEGFAGTVTLDGDNCTWHRAVNWHGQPETMDIGHIAFDDQGRMIETGVEADYTELWDHENSPFRQAFHLTGLEYSGTLAFIGTQFVLALDTSGRFATKGLVQQLEQGVVPSETPHLFNRLYAIGGWREGQAVARLATQPKSEGQVVLTLADGEAIWHRTDFHGAMTDVTFAAVAADMDQTFQ